MINYYFNFILILGSFTVFIVGYLAYRRKNDNPINLTWFYFSVCASLWSIFYYLTINTEVKQYAFLYINVVNLFGILIVLLWFTFLLKYLEIYKRFRYYAFFLYSFGALMYLSSFSKWFVADMVPKFVFNYYVVPGLGYFIFTIFFIAVISQGMYFLFVNYKRFTGVKSLQVKYFFIASALGFLGGLNVFTLAYNIPFPPYLLILYTTFPLIITYTIVKHRFMDIRVVLRTYAVYISSLVSIIIPSLLFKNLVDKFFPKTEQYADYFILLLAIIVFPSLKTYFYKVANKYFFSSLYDDRELVKDLSDKLGSTLEIRRIYEYISEVLKKAFHTRKIAFLTYDETVNEYEINYRKDLGRVKPKGFLGNEILNKKFSSLHKPIILSDISKIEYNENKRIYDLMKEWDMEIVVPFSMKKKVIGLLLLSRKESGDVYNDTDLRVLELIGMHATMAIKNAQLYFETLDFNLRLKNEIEKATYELLEANKKLKKLDQAKSEFVSIASHQLRTPLTIVKGYISMILEDNFGHIPAKQRDPLKKVYESNERLINLVENLLNISRIESGRLRFSYEETQLETMVESVFEELQESTKRKGLDFEYIKPKKKLPIINIDREKIRQVIMNLTDNSIKYTEKGYVKINLCLFGDKIKFCVTDSGMGISPDDLPKLFTKFTRGQDTSLVHTEGTGLGLYVAKQMVEAHGGKAWAESDGVGKGSRFCFVLPLVSDVKHTE